MPIDIDPENSEDLVSLEDVERQLFRPWSAKLATERTIVYQDRERKLMLTWPMEDEEGLAKQLSRLQAKLGV